MSRPPSFGLCHMSRESEKPGTQSSLCSFPVGAPFGFVEQGKDVGGLIQGFHDGLVRTLLTWLNHEPAHQERV